MTITATFLIIWTCFSALVCAQAMKYLNKEGEISFGNVYLSAEENFFHKLGSLLSHQTTRSIEECWFKCVQNKECLSVNTIALDKSRYRCQLLNWAGTGFEKYLVPKANSKFMQMQTVCSPHPCQNGGQCTVKDGGTNYTCTCTNHTGRNCEINVCSPNPCQNGGRCNVKDEGNNYTCTCFNQYFTGRNCETNILCMPSPCQNGGQCSLKDGGTNYTCTCVGHTGRNCEINMCSPNPCQNGGQCTVKDGGTNYTCTCVGHTGRNCEINMCSPNPCKNGGLCTVKDGGTNYSCSCRTGYIGINCEIKIPSLSTSSRRRRRRVIG
ncbi:fibropellin-3 [Exaiptasia diaphana]|uniref:EGF-like domain-containing protein n=1 Tax=Exaiptasia diaphana TaxID=2652724 RepID=A0A913XXX1_EXADI|nr:fibropellin-3 [Exaiptasia diaphana]